MIAAPARISRTSSRSFFPILLSLCIALPVLFAPEILQAQTVRSTAAGPGQAILVRGSDPVKGVPGFGKNALPALYGEYATSMAGEDLVLRVWATREALYLKAGFWAARKVGSYTLREARAPENDDELPAGTAFLLSLAERPFPSGGLGALPDEWSIVFALPAGGGSAEQSITNPARTAALDSFRLHLLDRFSYFLSQARLPTDVSFPANVEY